MPAGICTLTVRSVKTRPAPRQSSQGDSMIWPRAPAAQAGRGLHDLTEDGAPHGADLPRTAAVGAGLDRAGIGGAHALARPAGAVGLESRSLSRRRRPLLRASARRRRPGLRRGRARPDGPGRTPAAEGPAERSAEEVLEQVAETAAEALEPPKPPAPPAPRRRPSWP